MSSLPLSRQGGKKGRQWGSCTVPPRPPFFRPLPGPGHSQTPGSAGCRGPWWSWGRNGAGSSSLAGRGAGAQPGPARSCPSPSAVPTRSHSIWSPAGAPKSQPPSEKRTVQAGGVAMPESRRTSPGAPQHLQRREEAHTAVLRRLSANHRMVSNAPAAHSSQHASHGQPRVHTQVHTHTHDYRCTSHDPIDAHT